MGSISAIHFHWRPDISLGYEFDPLMSGPDCGCCCTPKDSRQEWSWCCHRRTPQLLLRRGPRSFPVVARIRIGHVLSLLRLSSAMLPTRNNLEEITAWFWIMRLLQCSRHPIRVGCLLWIDLWSSNDRTVEVYFFLAFVEMQILMVCGLRILRMFSPQTYVGNAWWRGKCPPVLYRMYCTFFRLDLAFSRRKS